jgi:hypothetical protein
MWKVERCDWLQFNNEEELRVSAVLFYRKQQKKLNHHKLIERIFVLKISSKLMNCKTIMQYMIISLFPFGNARL